MIAAQPAPGTAGVRHRRVVRPAVLVAVLLGLFLMHGGPAAGDGGCHGTMSEMAAVHPAPAAMAPHGSGHAEASGWKAAEHADEAMRGALCLATTPRSEMPLPPLAAVAFVLPAALLLPWVRRAYGDARRRGPPADGRGLLLQVCVART
ncbi:hypothetical protein [Streptomyces sp. NPDC008092]|uniref:hypothetical protein n=1 Tax=Streptomyces sp. NPDC008092 TaxID=3364808 RepID=UPI0036E7CF9E